MDDLPTRPRRVVVLGSQPNLDVRSIARRVSSEQAELVLLSVGSRPTVQQAAVVQDALDASVELGLWLDAVLVPTVREAKELVRPEEEVVIAASGSQLRMFERSLGRVVREPHDVRESSPHPPSGVGRTRRGLGVRIRAHERQHVSTGVGPRTPPLKLAEGGEVDAPLDAGGSESVEALTGHYVALPALVTVVTPDEARASKRAPLRVYLGAAPGVGKTYAMLGEGRRRNDRGTIVAVGFVQTYERRHTTEMLEGLEVVPPRWITYRGTAFEEMDTDALIRRRPEVALIDELAHTNIPGARRAKRWEDVIDVLSEGIEVITTLNVQHLASLNDVVAKITGIRQQETIPDWVLDLADQVELVDMSPHALQRRMVHGNVYPDPRKAELALRRFFTTENLTALRELALMRVADQVDAELLARWSRAGTPETRERILVCVSRPDVAEDLIRRGARIAQRTRGDLLVAHAASGEERVDSTGTDSLRGLVQDLGGDLHVLHAEDAVAAVLSFAYQQHVTQILVGESTRSRWQELLRGSFVNRLIQRASNVDIHVIARRER